MESNDRLNHERALYRAKSQRAGAFPLERTALLIIDPVNDFLSKGGAAYEMTKGTLLLNDVIGNLKKLIEGARELGLPVLFGPMAYTEEDYAEHEIQRRSGVKDLRQSRRLEYVNRSKRLSRSSRQFFYLKKFS